jgi:S1-C subfamily serine protease
MDVRDIDENIVNVFRLGKTSGAIVVEINRNSPAEKAGIEPGDIILEINGQKVNKLDDFNINIYDMSVGDEVELKILRDDKEINKTLELTAYPKNRR